jgi:hypothetical protein
MFDGIEITARPQLGRSARIVHQAGKKTFGHEDRPPDEGDGFLPDIRDP